LSKKNDLVLAKLFIIRKNWKLKLTKTSHFLKNLIRKLGEYSMQRHLSKSAKTTLNPMLQWRQRYVKQFYPKKVAFAFFKTTSP
jgi:hypothetical protein